MQKNNRSYLPVQTNELSLLIVSIEHCVKQHHSKLAATLWQYAYQLLAESAQFYGLDCQHTLAHLRVLKSQLMLKYPLPGKIYLIKLSFSAKNKALITFMIQLISRVDG